MVFIDAVKFEKELKEFEDKYNYFEREYFIQVIGKRLVEEKQRLKRKEVVSDTMNDNPMLKKLGKFMGGD